MCDKLFNASLSDCISFDSDCGWCVSSRVCLNTSSFSSWAANYFGCRSVIAFSPGGLLAILPTLLQLMFTVVPMIVCLVAGLVFLLSRLNNVRRCYFPRNSRCCARSKLVRTNRSSMIRSWAWQVMLVCFGFGYIFVVILAMARVYTGSIDVDGSVNWLKGLLGLSVFLLWIHASESMFEIAHLLMEGSMKSSVLVRLLIPLAFAAAFCGLSVALALFFLHDIALGFILADVLIAGLILCVKVVVWRSQHRHSTDEEVFAFSDKFVGVDAFIYAVGVVVLTVAGVVSMFFDESTPCESVVFASSLILSTYSFACHYAWKCHMCWRTRTEDFSYLIQ